MIDDFGCIARTRKSGFWRCRQTSPVAVLLTRRTRAKWQLKRTIAGMVLIHLPMAPLSKQPLEKDTLRPDMSSDEIGALSAGGKQRAAYAVGLNNHMGSAMTSSLFGMQKVMQALEHCNLYFLDSMTIGNSRAMRAASARCRK